MRTLRIFILLLPLAALALAQDAATQKRFAGTWEAKLKDKTVCTLKLEAGETITGDMHPCDLNVNEQGELIEPESASSDDKPSPVLHPKIDGDTLSFSVKDSTDEDVMKFELKLTGARQAELHFIGAPIEIKPIQFEKK